MEKEKYHVLFTEEVDGKKIKTEIQVERPKEKEKIPVSQVCLTKQEKMAIHKAFYMYRKQLGFPERKIVVKVVMTKESDAEFRSKCTMTSDSVSL